MKTAKFALRVTSLGVLCVALAGCTGEDPGKPVPAPTPQAAESSAAPSGPGSKGVFGTIQACDVLDNALNGQEYDPGKVSNAGSYNGCEASKRGIAARLDMDDLQGIDDLQSDPALTYPGKINGRPAKQVREGVADGGFCKVAFEVAPKARAMVTVVLGSDGPTDEACTQAQEIARMVEPQLPKA